MQYDWSDAWLQQAAGWKAVKEGVALHRRGLIQNARLNEGACQGTFGGAKARRVKVQRLSPTLAETFCGCPENLRTGAMCEHAVAVILAARETMTERADSGPTITSSPKDDGTKAYRIRFFPSWQREWSRGRLTVSVETSDRPIDEFDTIFHQWLMKQGLPKKPSPWTLSLQGGELEEFLRAISGHGEIAHEKQTIVCNMGQPEVKVKSRSEGDQWVFELRDSPGEFLGGKSGSWLMKNERLFEIYEGVAQKFLYQLFTEKKS